MTRYMLAGLLAAGTTLSTLALGTSEAEAGRYEVVSPSVIRFHGPSRAREVRPLVNPVTTPRDEARVEPRDEPAPSIVKVPKGLNGEERRDARNELARKHKRQLAEATRDQREETPAMEPAPQPAAEPAPQRAESEAAGEPEPEPEVPALVAR